MRFSYCCGKPVRRKEGVKVRGQGYYCDRCKKPLTVYGNPRNEDDKAKLAESLKVKGRGYKVLPNGDLNLIDTVYPYANEGTQSNKQFSRKWVIVDKYGRYITTVMLEKDDGALYEIMEPFEKRLKKEQLIAFELRRVNEYGIDEAKMREQVNLRGLLEKMGWSFRADGRIK